MVNLAQDVQPSQGGQSRDSERSPPRQVSPETTRAFPLSSSLPATAFSTAAMPSTSSSMPPLGPPTLAQDAAAATSAFAGVGSAPQASNILSYYLSPLPPVSPASRERRRNLCTTAIDDVATALRDTTTRIHPGGRRRLAGYAGVDGEAFQAPPRRQRGGEVVDAGGPEAPNAPADVTPRRRAGRRRHGRGRTSAASGPQARSMDSGERRRRERQALQSACVAQAEATAAVLASLASFAGAPISTRDAGCSSSIHGSASLRCAQDQLAGLRLAAGAVAASCSVQDTAAAAAGACPLPSSSGSSLVPMMYSTSSVAGSMSIADFIVHAVTNGVIDVCSVMEAARHQLLGTGSSVSDREMTPPATQSTDEPSSGPPPSE